MTHRKKWMTKYKSIAFHLIVALNFPHDIYFFYLQFLLFSIIKYIFVRCTRVSEHRMWYLCRNDERIFGSPQQFIKKNIWKTYGERNISLIKCRNRIWREYWKLRSIVRKKSSFPTFLEYFPINCPWENNFLTWNAYYHYATEWTFWNRSISFSFELFTRASLEWASLNHYLSRK